MLPLLVLCIIFSSDQYGMHAMIDGEEDRIPTDIEIPVPIQSVSGGRLSLPCDITSPILDDEVYLVLWYKDDVANPIYSLDARRGHLGQARHATNDILAGRAYFSSVPQPAVLQVDRVTQDDEGIYRCRVDFKKARTQHSSLVVTIVVPPKIPIIKDYNGKVLSGVIGPYNEGDNLHLICQVEGGNPTPSLLWWRGRRIIDDSYEVTGHETTRNEIFIEKLQRKDLMTTLTCQGSNNKISPPVEASITLDINFRPQSVHVKGKRKKLSAQKLSQFECEAKGSRPPATISWRKGSFKLKNTVERVSAQGNITTSTLTITPTSDDNGKFLYCQADNAAIPGSAIEDGWKLDVHYVPQLNLRLGSKLRHTNIIEDSDVYFECNIRANPWVSETGWRFDGNELQNNMSSGVILNNQSLVLQKVSKSHRGRYSCIATNNEGQGESNHVYLRVQYSPICKEYQDAIYTTPLNYPVQIPCEVESDPEEVTFFWEFNGTSSSGESLMSQTHGSGLQSFLTYTPRTESDFGTLYCWAKNTVGTQKIPCTFFVIPAEPPSQVYNCSVEEQGDTFVRILCNATEQVSEEMEHSYAMEIIDGDDIVYNATSRTPQFLVLDLIPDNSYIAYIYINNAAGRSKPTVIHFKTDSPPFISSQEEEIWNLEESPIIFVAAAIGGGFLIVALIIICSVKFHHKKRQRKDSLSGQGNEKSAHNSEKSCDSCSEGCTCSLRDEEKIRENIPDVVVFSEKAKSEEAERLKSFSQRSPYWSPITLPGDPEKSSHSKVQGVENAPPWSTDWVIPPQPVEMVTLQFHKSTTSVEESGKKHERQSMPLQTLSTIPEGANAMMSTSSTSFSPLPVSCAKQTDV
ncbi:uncharacterized protein LOC129226707 [Uloborus diversus]|uniref:uncharacterized protein LOC129226707 n=1 Tax=Uloborus diversus TaxID=327109 RepID=UPI0024091F55|nr:uncharacterized protein LOC129226707 [Uloborus diversus]